MSYRIQYQVTTEAPVLLTRIVGNIYILNTDEYLPGSAVRGMLAYRYIHLNDRGKSAHQDGQFYGWFLKGDLQFTNAYLYSEDERGARMCFYPAPLSIGKEKNTETIVDLMYREDFEDSIESKKFVYLSGDGVYEKAVRKSLHFHHARDRATGAAREGIFFNYEAIERGQTFQGSIIGSKDDLEAFLSLVKEPFIGYLGRSKNAQYGKVSFRIISKTPESFYAEPDSAPKDFTQLETGWTSLTLLSNTIIYDQNGFPTTDLKVLEKHLDSRIEKAFVKTGDTENFVAIWNLRRPSERCFLAGSCFMIEVTDDNKEHLLQLQREGLGERRNEGFGRMVLGWQQHGGLNEGKIKSASSEKPDAELPALAREILRSIVKKHIMKEIEVQALRIASNFENDAKFNRGFPSKSLLGRLEWMVKRHRQSSGSDSFQQELKALKARAKNQLDSCRNNETKLLPFLETFQINIGEKLKDKPELLKMAEAVAFDLDNEQLKKELYCNYLQAFFSAMRRLQKQKAKNTRKS